FGESLFFKWYSNKGFRYSSDYSVCFESMAGWFEVIHKPVSCFGFSLPIMELMKKDRLEELLTCFCNILRPIHGVMGLGIQQCYEEERYQHLEYEVGRDFLGVDIPGGLTDDKLRNGIRTINWLTFFNNQWLEKLGGLSYLKGASSNSAIKITPYSDGVIIRAGDWPELGWVKANPYPELYVRVNKILKPIRAPEIDSLGYGSIAGEIRFDRNSTARWLARFDVDLPPFTAL
ncbi:DUF3396 domain-containing protein, partial [Cronobacter sakazakii]|nr:DUF3396 domain-containing protein [Cronobacter sakazakii]